jgi:diguanylate cyclase (GGDEF)-like protein/PAS domain S-box-containing protein
MWWPVTGLVLVIVVRCPRRWWWVLLPVFAVVNGIANHSLGSLPAVLTYSVVNVVEVLTAAAILREGPGPGGRRLRTRHEATRFVLAIAAAVLFGAVLVAGRAVLFPTDSPWHLVTRGYLTTHTLGLFAFAPLLLPGHSWWKSGVLRHLEFGAVLAAAAAIDGWVFLDAGSGGRAFPVLLPIIWAAIRLDPLRATATSLVTCAVAAYATSRGLGTFAGVSDLDHRQLITQSFIATVTITTLALVLITRHRARLAAQASDSEQTLKIAIQQALVGIYSIRLDDGHVGEIMDVNTTMCLMLGYEPEELHGAQSRVLRAYPDSEESATLGTRLNQLASGAIDAFQRETQFVTSTGEILWVEVSATRVTPKTAPPFALVYLHDLTGREENKRMLESMALHDALTGLPNRAVLFPRLDDLLRSARRDGATVGLMYLDLDGFKPVNDTYGHAAGDAVLVEVARRLSDSVRPGDTVARLGGDEFAVLAANIRGAADLDMIARRIHRALADPVTLPNGVGVVIGTSIGSAVGGGGTTADDLVHDADVEMYRAKHARGSSPSAIARGRAVAAR